MRGNVRGSSRSMTRRGLSLENIFICFQLNDVAAGGGTAFLDAGINISPTKVS